MSDRRTAAATPSTASLVSAHVLVTGGCGSIGSRLVSLLVRLGARVRVVDSLNAYPFDYRREFAAGDPALAEVDLLVGDVQDEAIARRAVEGVTHIVHAAAFADVGASIREPNADFRANVVGTQQMLSAASASSIERFVFISSASVYGNPASTAPGRVSARTTRPGRCPRTRTPSCGASTNRGSSASSTRCRR